MFKNSLKYFAVGLMATGLMAFAQNAPQATPKSNASTSQPAASTPAKPTSKVVKHSNKKVKKTSHKTNASASHVKKAKTVKSSS